MSSPWHRFLSRHKGKTLIEFCRRPKIEERILGFVIDFSPDFLLIQRFYWSFAFDGYCVLPSDAIKNYRVFDRSTSWENRAISKLKIRPAKLPKFRLESWYDVICDTAAHFPLVTFFREIKSADECLIGVPHTITDSTVTFENLDSNAVWSGTRRLKVSDVTRIDFDGGYERALAVTAPKRVASAGKIRLLYSPSLAKVGSRLYVPCRD